VTAAGKGTVVNELPLYPEQDVIGPLLIVPTFEVPDGYRVTNEREAIKVLIEF
jgi:hypothetical protein